jgi:hypothetical protein
MLLPDDADIRNPANLVRAVEADDAVVLEVGGEEYERIPVDASDVHVVAEVMQAILGDEAYLVPEESDPAE